MKSTARLSPVLLLLASPTGNSFQVPFSSVRRNTGKNNENLVLLRLRENPSEDESDNSNPRKISNVFVMEEPGSLVGKTNPFANLDPDKVANNFLGGNVGERGEGLTALTLLLLVAILAGFSLPLPLQLVAGPGLMLAGGALIVISISDLGSNNLTPFLSPTSQASLITTGIYSKIRHPIYTGLMGLCAGFSVATGDATRLVLTALLMVLLHVKSDKEEERLRDKFPQYADYRKTTGKFLPGDWTMRD